MSREVLVSSAAVFDTNLTKVSFEFLPDKTIVKVEYNIKYKNEKVVSCFERSKAFPINRDVVSIIEKELSGLEFLTWVGVRNAN